MKKIAIITEAVALEGEKGYSRFRDLSKYLSEIDEFEIELITTTFQHWEKKQRNIDLIKQKERNVNYKITLIHEPGYKKNIDVLRIFSHRKFTKGLIKYLNNNFYDLIYCIIPDNHCAAKVSKYCKRNSIKLVIDIEDLWPEAMRMVFHPPIISNLIYYPFFKHARTAYQNANAFIGTSDEYRDVPVKKYGVNPGVIKKTVYVGCDLEDFDNGVNNYIKDIEKIENEFWITYAGNLGESYDITTLIESTAEIEKKGYKDIKIKILGGGPLEEKFRILKDNLVCENVEFLGYVEYHKMAAYLVKSDVVINSFVKKAPQSIVTKIGDYLASGKAMINTCSSIEFRTKCEQDGFGINVEAENKEELTKCILELYDDKDMTKRMGIRAREIAELQFDRKCSYKEIVNLVKGLLK